MEEELQNFLKERGLHGIIKRMAEDKIDCQTLLALSDDQLKQYISTPGDQFHIRKFCTEMLKKTEAEKRKGTLLQKLRRKLRMKQLKKSSDFAHSDDEEEEDDKADQRRRKLVGNANASKSERKIEIGWMHFNEHDEEKGSFAQIKKGRGGGTREVIASKLWTAENILNKGLSLFFPNDESKLGRKSEFHFEVMDFMENKFDSAVTVEEFYRRTSLKLIRFYIFSKKKQNVDSFEDSDSSLPDPADVSQEKISLELSPISRNVHKIAYPNEHLIHTETSVLQKEPNGMQHTQTMHSDMSDGCANQLLTSTPQGSPLLTCNSNMYKIAEDQEILFSLDRNAYHLMSAFNPQLKFGVTATSGQELPGGYDESLNDTQYIYTLSSSNTTANDEVLQASSLIQSEQERLQQQAQLRTEESSQTSVFHGELQSVELGQNSPALGAHHTADIVSEDKRIKIHQGMVFSELISLYKKEDMKLSVNSVVRVLPNGEFEMAEGVGLLRDIFTEFWETFYLKCAEGDDVKVPILRHDMGELEWSAIGRIVTDGWRTVDYFPVRLAKPIFEQALFTSSATDVMPVFLDFIPQSERDIIREALENFDNVDNDDLIDVLQNHQCKKMHTKDNIHSIVKEIAEKEVLQEPRFIIECFRKVFCGHLEIDQTKLNRIYEEKMPTVKKMLQVLKFPDVLDNNQQTSANHLKRFIRGLDRKGLESFLRFSTGANLMCSELNIEFTRLDGFERRPQAHTCGNILKIPTTYENFADMREEFNNILSSGVWEMGYV